MNGIHFIVFSLLLTSTLFDVVGVGAQWKRRVLHKRQTEEFNAGELPSHLPSPPEDKKKPPENKKKPPATQVSSSEEVVYPGRPNLLGNMGMNLEGGGQGYSQLNLDIGENVGSEETTMSTEEATTACSDDGDGDDDDDDDDKKKDKDEEDVEAPLGLDETILIIVPQFKYTIHGFPAWAGANVRLSLPITIFFEELKWPKPPVPLPPYLTSGFGSFLFNGKYGKWREGSKRRASRSILSLPPGEALVGGERATIIPKLEQLLGTFGIKSGRSCLLRAVCEVHEAELSRSYGFLGEFLTHIFTISHSMFAETHLTSYLEAEKNGKEGNCSQYFKKCAHSLFEQEQTGSHYCELGAWNCP